MAVKGTVKEYSGYTNKVGFFKARLLAINPTLEQITLFQDISNMKEPEYIKDYTDSKTDIKYDQVVNTIWLQAVDENNVDIPGAIFSKKFPIINKPRVNKEGNNKQFINNIGNCTWAADANALKDPKYAWFTKREYREALTGEEKFYGFFQKWLSLDWADPETELSFNMQDLFKGRFKELQKLLQTNYKDQMVCGNLTIHISIPAPTDENPEPAPKAYQNIYDEFLPGSAYKFLKNDIKVKPTWVQKYIDGMKGEYGCKDYFVIEEMRDYNPSENPIATASTIHNTTNPNDHVPDPTTIDDLPF